MAGCVWPARPLLGPVVRRQAGGRRSQGLGSALLCSVALMARHLLCGCMLACFSFPADHQVPPTTSDASLATREPFHCLAPLLSRSVDTVSQGASRCTQHTQQQQQQQPGFRMLSIVTEHHPQARRHALRAHAQGTQGRSGRYSLRAVCGAQRTAHSKRGQHLTCRRGACPRRLRASACRERRLLLVVAAAGEQPPWGLHPGSLLLPGRLAVAAGDGHCRWRRWWRWPERRRRRCRRACRAAGEALPRARPRRAGAVRGKRGPAAARGRAGA